MVKLKSLLAALAVGAALLSQAASAADISNPPQILVLIDGSADFGATFAAGNMGNTFADKYLFSVTDPGMGTADAIVASISRSALVGLNLTSFDLYDIANNLLVPGTMVSTGAMDVWTVASAGALPMGDYYIQVSGALVSSTSGAYGGNLMLAVPEPQSYAMLAGGLGLLGVAARRRRKLARPGQGTSL